MMSEMSAETRPALASRSSASQIVELGECLHLIFDRRLQFVPLDLRQIGRTTSIILAISRNPFPFSSRFCRTNAPNFSFPPTIGSCFVTCLGVYTPIRAKRQ